MSASDSSELNNLRYKTGCMRKPRQEPLHDASSVDQILETESASRGAKPWQRLNRTDRVAKLRAFAVAYCDKHELDATERVDLERTLLAGLERRRLTGARDVVYDAQNGVLTAIPCLCHQPQAKRFTLKRPDRRVSTLKSLGAGKQKRARRRTRAHASPGPEIDTGLKETKA